MSTRALLVVLAALACACSPGDRPRPNVLIVTIDTWRADRLSFLGSPRATTPCIDAFAKKALVLARADTPRAKTTPAIASLMTGLYPHEHGVRDLFTPLGVRVPTFAERLRDAGWRTGAIVGNYVLQSRLSGLERGFDQWTEELPQTQGVPPDGVPQRTARSLTDGALAALGIEDASAHDGGPRASFVRDGAPWMLWLHYMDPHGSYDPPAEHRVFRSDVAEPLDPASVRPGALADYNVPVEARLADGLVDAARVKDLYDGEVRFVDAEIGRLLDRLRASGMLANTLVVIAADHGESLGEHGYWFEHGRDAYDACCHVPLLVRFPDGAKDGASGRSDADTSLVDVAPTLLDWLGLEPLAPKSSSVDDATKPVRGRSLLSTWLGKDKAPHVVFREKVDAGDAERAIQHKSARLGAWELVVRYARVVDDGKSVLRVLSEERLAGADAIGATTRSAELPPGAESILRAELARFVACDPRLAELAEELARARAAVDPETLRKIEALGY